MGLVVAVIRRRWPTISSAAGLSRHGRDWTGPYKRVVDAAAKLSCKAVLIDDELIEIANNAGKGHVGPRD